MAISTALHYPALRGHGASFREHVDVARILLEPEDGADITAKTFEEWTLLHLAVEASHPAQTQGPKMRIRGLLCIFHRAGDMWKLFISFPNVVQKQNSRTIAGGLRCMTYPPVDTGKSLVSF